MKFKLKAYSIWEDGKRVDAQGNPHQEDSLFPAHGHLTPADRLFILCDGMGGHDAGEVASQTVCESMAHTILSADPDPEGPFSDSLLLKAIDDAYAALDSKDTGAEKKMGTTMTFLKLHEGGATVAHMGDSRVYQIRPGKDGETTRIMFMTEDHSLVNDLVKIGELTHEEARHSSQKNVITRAMQPGADRRCRADLAHLTDIRPGDYFYLCSDGMLEDDGMESGRVLCNIFSVAGGDDAAKIEILRKSTKQNKDNHTAIIVHITDVEGAPVEEDIPVAFATESTPANVSSEPARVSRPQPKKKGPKSILFFLATFVIFACVIYSAYAYFINPASDPDDTEAVDSEGSKRDKVATDVLNDDSNRHPGQGGREVSTPSRQGRENGKTPEEKPEADGKNDVDEPVDPNTVGVNIGGSDPDVTDEPAPVKTDEPETPAKTPEPAKTHEPVDTPEAPGQGGDNQ